VEDTPHPHRPVAVVAASEPYRAIPETGIGQIPRLALGAPWRALERLQASATAEHRRRPLNAAAVRSRVTAAVSLPPRGSLGHVPILV
jgi:hypothetical protein